MRYFLIIFLLLNFNYGFSYEMSCKFEEVYKDGSIQTGFIAVKNKKIRYQYNDDQLFTLFANEGKIFIVKNNDLSNFQKLNKDTSNLEEIFDLIISNNLKFEGKIVKDNLVLNFEKSRLTDFYKRISVNAINMNLSIYFNDCNIVQMHDRFFQHSPYFEIN